MLVIQSFILGTDVTGDLYDDGHLIVHGTGPTNNYTTDSPLNGDIRITSITVESGVTYLGNSLFRNLPNLTDILPFPSTVTNIGTFLFRDCTSLQTLPSGLFDSCTEATSFSGCFFDCSSLTSIPIGLFDNNTSVNTFTNCFRSCSSLTSIPVGLFDNNTQVTTFSACFYGCSSLTSIPSGLFDNNTQVTTFFACFYDCSLTSIPSGLFDSCTEVTSFSWCFYNCTSLTSIPSGLFDNNASVTNFSWCFSGSSLSSIPSGLFDNNTQVTNFSRCFNNCINLTLAHLSGNLAQYGDFAFDDCSNLETIINPYQGNQTVHADLLTATTGNLVSPKYAYCYLENINFITAAESRDYTIKQYYPIILSAEQENGNIKLTWTYEY